MSSGASEWTSERMNERSGTRERSKQCGESERVCGASKYEQRSEWPSTLCVDFIVILPIVRLKRIRGAAMTMDSETHTHTHTQMCVPQWVETA